MKKGLYYDGPRMQEKRKTKNEKRKVKSEK